MEIAEILLIGAAILVFGDLVQLVNSKKGGTKGMGIPMAPLACLLIIGSYLILAQAFVANNFRYEEVYAYSSSGLPVLGRLYASWASSASSWLFLTFLLALGYLAIRFRMRDKELRLKAFEVLDVLFLFFIVVVLLQSPFRLLPEAQMDGQGLNPLLKTPWMLIHPPVVFIGYALTFFSFAFTFDTFGSERPSASVLVRVFAQLSWLFLTLGIALGGLWAYEVLGWGGYWAWDPVETASLIPWITLTAFFHLTTATSGRETSSRELMVMVTSALIVLATAITRGGLAVSVHAFGSSPIGLVLILLMGIMIAYFLYGQRRSGEALFEFDIETTSVYSSALSLSFLSLILISLVCLWGLLVPILSSAFGGDPTSVDPSFFNKWTYPFVLIFVASLIGCHLSSRLTMKRYAGLIGALLALGVGAAFLGFPTSNALANLGIPFTLFALGSVVYGSLEKIWGKRRSGLLLGRSFIHLGVVFIVLGILLSSSMVSDYGDMLVEPKSTLKLEDVEIEFGEFSFIEPFGNVHTASTEACCSPEAAGLSIPVTARLDGTTLKGDLKILLYTLHGIVSRPIVLRSLERDVYLVLHQTEGIYTSLVHIMIGMPMPPLEFAVNVMTFPLLNLIWLGVVLMSLGIILPIFGTHRSKK
jgi:cytochrome c-type biogenesis protein CcmF